LTWDGQGALRHQERRRASAQLVQSVVLMLDGLIEVKKLSRELLRLRAKRRRLPSRYSGHRGALN